MYNTKEIEKLKRAMKTATLMANISPEDTKQALRERLYQSRDIVNSKLNEISDTQEKTLVLKNIIKKIKF